MRGARVKQLRIVALATIVDARFPNKALEKLSNAEQVTCRKEAAFLCIELKRRWKDSSMRLNTMHGHVKHFTNRYWSKLRTPRGLGFMSSRARRKLYQHCTRRHAKHMLQKVTGSPKWCGSVTCPYCYNSKHIPQEAMEKRASERGERAAKAFAVRKFKHFERHPHLLQKLAADERETTTTAMRKLGMMVRLT